MSEYSTVVGLDLGDKVSHYCVVDDEGKVVSEGRVGTTPEALRNHFSALLRTLVALEVGTHSPWVSRLLKQCGHTVLVANASRLRMIYDSRRKNDRLDAMALARVARMDPQLLYPITHRGEQAQRDMAVLRSRDLLVRARTQMITHVRGIVKSFGSRLRKCSAPSFHRRAAEEIPEELKSLLGPVVENIARLSEQIRWYEQTAKQAAAERYPITSHLQQVGGIGPLTSLGYALAVEDPGRFRKSRTVGAYVGLAPRQDQSGESDRQLRITKAGNAYARRLLISSAHYILGPFGPDTDLRRWGLALAARGGKNAKKRAAVAVARKLAVLLHRLWITGEVYQPLGYGDAERAAPAASDELDVGPFSAAPAARSAPAAASRA